MDVKALMKLVFLLSKLYKKQMEVKQHTEPCPALQKDLELINM